ncbi:MAG: hypothetical protein CL613_07055, partial [Aquimarina sp.]|nr:hypothetical protein [Aquimarina sp.]
MSYLIGAMPTQIRYYILKIIFFLCLAVNAQGSNNHDIEKVRDSIENFLVKASNSINRTELEKAMANIIIAKDLAIDYADRISRARTNMALAKLYRELGDSEKAEEEILNAIRIQTEDKYNSSLAYSKLIYASIAIELDKFEIAKNSLNEAELISTKEYNKELEGAIKLYRGLLELEQENPK